MDDAHAKANASGWYETICELVAAINCDYGRLEELRDERESLHVDIDDENEELRQAAIAALSDWDDEHGEELAGQLSRYAANLMNTASPAARGWNGRIGERLGRSTTRIKIRCLSTAASFILVGRLLAYDKGTE